MLDTGDMLMNSTVARVKKVRPTDVLGRVVYPPELVGGFVVWGMAYINEVSIRGRESLSKITSASKR